MAVLVGQQAPEFTGKAVLDGETIKEIKLSDYKGRYVVLFFYPFDFTFVCPTELIAFQEKLAEFEKRNTQILACSIDSHHTHRAYLKTPKAQGGIQGVTYPIISDVKKEISEKYDVLHVGGMAYRGLFLIDKNGVVRHQLVNDLQLGRSIDEALRMVDALQYFEKNGEVCPANWHAGQKAIRENIESVAAYLSQVELVRA